MTTSFLEQRNIIVSDYKHRTRYQRRQTEEKIGVVVRVMEEVREILLIPPEQKVVISELSGCHGLFHISSQTIMVDPFRSIQDFVTVLCHECIHAEQYFLGRLSVFWDALTGKMRLLFDGTEYQTNPFVYNSNEEYYSYPWEREAYFRQTSVSDVVMKRIGL